MKRLRWLVWVTLLLLLAAGGAAGWYHYSLSAPGEFGTPEQRFAIISGESPVAISQRLEAEGLIRSNLTFDLYARLHGLQSQFKAGVYAISPTESARDIAQKLAEGRTDTLTVTIAPGTTLKSIEGSLVSLGFTQQEVTEAFRATYDHPLLHDKPSNATLEGYLFAETYQIDAGSSLQALFRRGFDDLYRHLQEDGLLNQTARRGLNIHETLTLSSIIQMETADPETQRQIAQVFLTRLEQGMRLDADPTFRYAAELLGVEPRPSLESAYNTRIHEGLPPGPIATMNLSAIRAVADPAPGDYLYFVAGDDGETYFARTLEEHERNVTEHCIELCKLFSD